MRRWIIESYTEPDTRHVRYQFIDSVTGHAWDARDFGYPHADFPTYEAADAFRAQVVADIGE